MTFEQCIEVILRWEAGYKHDPLDPGGETRFGISKRSYPDVDVANLKIEDAIEIYRRDFWDKLGVEKIPELHRLMYFDCAVNQGPGRARELYGKAKAMVDDNHVLDAFAKLRLNYYIGLPGWERFGKGWARRLLDVTLTSLF